MRRGSEYTNCGAIVVEGVRVKSMPNELLQEQRDIDRLLIKSAELQKRSAKARAVGDEKGKTMCSRIHQSELVVRQVRVGVRHSDLFTGYPPLGIPERD